MLKLFLCLQPVLAVLIVTFALIALYFVPFGFAMESIDGAVPWWCFSTTFIAQTAFQLK